MPAGVDAPIGAAEVGMLLVELDGLPIRGNSPWRMGKTAPGAMLPGNLAGV